MALSETLELRQVTIATGQSLSAALPIGALRLVGIVMPASWTAAALTFQASADGGTTWLDIYASSGSELSFSADAGRIVSVDPATLRGINNLKVRSGTSGTPVAQGADRVIGLLIRAVD